MRLTLGVGLLLATSAFAGDWKARLADASLEVRVLAARELAARDAADAVPELIECLADESAELRRLAARALGSAGPAARPALPALERRFDDESDAVRAEALAAVSRIGAIEAVSDAVQRDRRVLELIEPEHDFVLRELLKAGSWHVRLWVVQLLGRRRRAHAEWTPLVGELATSDSAHAVRIEALEFLAATRKPAAIPYLVRQFGDADWRIRALAVFGVGMQDFDKPGVAESVQGLLSDRSPVVRAHACFALRASQKSAPLLRSLVEGEAKMLRLVAAAVLASWGEWSPDAADELVAAGLRAGFDAPYPHSMTRRHFRGGGRRDLFSAARTWPDVDSMARDGVLAAGEKAITSVRRAFEAEKYVQRRCELVHALGHLGAEKALRAALVDPELSVRRRAAASRAHLGYTDERTIEILVDCLVGAGELDRPVATGDIDWGRTAPGLIVKIGAPAIPVLEARLEKIRKFVPRGASDGMLATSENPCEAEATQVRILIRRIRAR